MQADKQTRDLKRSCLRLRDGLLFVPQQHRDETVYHIESTTESRFFRIGLAQYVFLSLLDGKTSFSAALALTARHLGPDALTEQDATQFCLWLLRNNLVRFSEASKNSSKTRESTKSIQEQVFQKLNPFWIRLPLGSPDRLFATVLPYCRWAFHPLSILMATLVCLSGLLTLLQNSERFALGMRDIFSPQNWLWMFACWVILKVVHEFAHGITCKHFGGTVKETGLIFILFAPMAYVDVTSSWRFPSKWQRIQVASVGMFVEIFIASLAMFAWVRTDSPLAAHGLHQVVMMAGLSTILFNANPLMRFDGYFILSDFLEIPNLYEEGSKQVHRLGSWLFFGRSPELFSTVKSNVRTWSLMAYGLAASSWKIVVGVTLMIGASTMFQGAGIVLGIAGLMMWFGMPLLRGLKTIHSQYYESRPAFFRAVMVSGCIALMLWGIWDWSPCPVTLRLPAIVDYEKASFVRAESNGFLDEVLVADGQHVEAGTPILRLRNPELHVEVQRLVAELKQSEQRERIARDEYEPATVQIERSKQRSIRAELLDKQTELNSLLVVAPREGRVVAGNLHDQVGTYFRKGDDLIILGDESKKECIVSVSQSDVQDALSRVGENVHIRIGSRRAISGQLKRIEPRASKSLPHVAFAASMGGPLPVQAANADSERAQDELEFVEARFTGVVTLATDVAQELASGERGTARVGWRSETWGRWIYRTVREYIEIRTAQTAGI